jgi:tetratricopeptide (TPR) repeat protein
LNKFLFIKYRKKAGILPCLFLCLIHSVCAQQWTFDKHALKAYDLALNLQIPEVHELLKRPETVGDYYVLSLAESLELLISEDAEKFKIYEDRFLERLEEKAKGPDAAYQFLHAEMRLQWAFVYLKFGHELDAALQLRQAFHIADECRRKYPDFLPIRKTTGLLEIIIGSVPEKYNWVLGVMGIEGAIRVGLADLEMVRQSTSPVAHEASLIYSLVQAFVFQKPDHALEEVKRMLDQKTDDGLLSFLGASLAIKNSNSELALNMLDTLAFTHKGIHLYYADYLRGEVYLHKAEYLNAISSYRWFINHYHGQNYIKDAYYKIGICYWLNGNVNDAIAIFKEARSKGKEASEADKHAARSLAENTFPNIQLSKVRYYTDGGYYKDAQLAIDQIVLADLPAKQDQVEYHYRRARLAHKQNKIEEAKTSYEKVIEITGEETWYFAPNACLQMGYLAIAQNKNEDARLFFTRALGYKKHEYKNSIDSKAKTALAQLKPK